MANLPRQYNVTIWIGRMPLLCVYNVPEYSFRLPPNGRPYWRHDP